MSLSSYFVWPLVVLIFLFLFRRQIGELISNIRRIKTPGVDVELASNADLTPNIQIEPSHHISWNNTGNLFWLGHDLMWTIHMCRCDEPPEKIIRGLTQINYHLDCLDLHARKSNELLIEAQSTINWNIERKRSIASKLEPLIREAGALAEQ